MWRSRLTAGALALALAPAIALAHGGLYRGPAGPLGTGDVNAGGPAGGMETDTASWQAWWAFQREVLLDLEGPVFGAAGRPGLLAPAPETVRERVVPALLAALERERDIDLVSGGLLALGKIGVEPVDGARVREVLLEHVGHSNQEVHETAVLALGALGDTDLAPTLADLALDSDGGRRLVGRTRVPPRTRAFAAYGLTLVARSSGAEAVRRFAVHHLAQLAAEEGGATRDAATAAVVGLGHLRLLSVPSEPADDGDEERGDPRPAASREGQIAFLESLLDDRGRDARLRAFVPVALARLCDGADERVRARVMERALAALAPRARVDDDVRAGWLLAAGRLGDNDDDALDARLRAALVRLVEDGARLERNLALLSLARVGGREGDAPRGLAASEVHARLMRGLLHGKSTERPWAALGLGLVERGNVDAGRPPAEGTRLTLRQAFERAASPSEQAAVAVALGLVREVEAAEMLVARTRNGDEIVRGHSAVALGMIGHAPAAADLRRLLARLRDRAGLLRETATGLALLGDGSAQSILVARLEGSRWLQDRLASAAALGPVGDARSVGPLLGILGDERESDTVRAFAAAALGNVCDRTSRAWNAEFGEDVLWWIAPPTLHDPVEGKGLLDLL